MNAATGQAVRTGQDPAGDTDQGRWTTGGRLAAWIANVSSMSVALSLTLHALVLLIAAIVSVHIVTAQRNGGGSALDLDVTITAPEPVGDLADAAITVAAPNSAPAVVPEIADSGVLDGAGGVDSPAEAPGLGRIADGLGGTGGGGVGEGLGIGGGAGEGRGASFFGVEARGSRFLYICDVSGSMNFDAYGAPNGKKLATLKAELNESIRGLLDHMSFFVIFFSSDAMPIQDTRKWVAANAAGKRFAADRIATVNAFGGTEPWPAFDIGFHMRPMPDAIFFMTDGEFEPEVAEQVRRASEGSKRIPIHCIAFISKAGEETLRKMAADSGGTYRFVEGTR